VTPTPSTSWAR